MTLVAALTSKGFFVSAERLKRYSEATEENFEELGAEKCFAHLLDCDLRKFGEGGVPEGLGKTDRNVFQGPAILQVLKIANITVMY